MNWVIILHEESIGCGTNVFILLYPVIDPQRVVEEAQRKRKWQLCAFLLKEKKKLPLVIRRQGTSKIKVRKNTSKNWLNKINMVNETNTHGDIRFPTNIKDTAQFQSQYPSYGVFHIFISRCICLDVLYL